MRLLSNIRQCSYLIITQSELNCCCNDDPTYPLKDVHLQCVVVEREEIWVRVAGLIAQFILQQGTQTHDESELNRVWTCVLLLFHCVSKWTTEASAVLNKVEWILNGILSTHHFYVGFLVEGLSKDRHDKDVDEEGDEKSDTWLDEVVFVGFLYFLLITAIDFTRLVNKGNKQNSIQSIFIKHPRSALRIF